MIDAAKIRFMAALITREVAGVHNKDVELRRRANEVMQEISPFDGEPLGDILKEAMDLVDN